MNLETMKLNFKVNNIMASSCIYQIIVWFNHYKSRLKSCNSSQKYYILVVFITAYRKLLNNYKNQNTSQGFKI